MRAMGNAKGRARVLWLGVLACALEASAPGQNDFDWKRDTVELTNGKKEHGVLIEAFGPEHFVLLHDGNNRDEIPRANVARLDFLRERLERFMARRKPGASASEQWDLVDEALAAGLAHMARLQAYRVLTDDAGHAAAHEFLGHKKSGDDWRWRLDGKSFSAEKFREASLEWKSRLVLESEHFVVQTDCGLKRALDVLFDLEALYLWWMKYVGPEVRAAEDVDDPPREKLTIYVHKSKDAPNFQALDSMREPYYDPTGENTTEKGGINLARTYFTPEGYRPEMLFELGTQGLIYSTLVLGKVKGAPTPDMKRLSFWAELGLAYWVGRHCGGEPGFAEIRAPFRQPFGVDSNTARRSLEPVSPGHDLRKTRNEVTNLIGLKWQNLVGIHADILPTRARCATFLSFLLEENRELVKRNKPVGNTRAGLWHYFREVYGTPRAHSSDAFNEGMGAEVETLEQDWKDWTRKFTSVLPSAK